MVELLDPVIAESATGVLGTLRLAGMMPVITHPERNPVMQGKIDTLRKLVECGCMLQVTGQSLLGRFGPGVERADRLCTINPGKALAGNRWSRPRCRSGSCTGFGSGEREVQLR